MPNVRKQNNIPQAFRVSITMTHLDDIIPDDENLREQSEGFPFKLSELWRQSALASDPSEVSNLFSVQSDLTRTGNSYSYCLCAHSSNLSLRNEHQDLISAMETGIAR
jgi:hypothetical protein